MNSVVKDHLLKGQALGEAIQAAKQGCDESRNQLFDQFRGYLRVVADSQIEPSLQRKFDASDVVQMTLGEAHKNFDQFSGDQYHLRAWLAKILLTNLIDMKRQYRNTLRRDISREQSLENVQSPSVQPTASTILEDRESYAQLRLAVSQLPERTRRLVELRHRDGLDFNQIGDKLNMTSAAARKLWSRTLVELKKRLASD